MVTPPVAQPGAPVTPTPDSTLRVSATITDAHLDVVFEEADGPRCYRSAPHRDNPAVPMALASGLFSAACKLEGEARLEAVRQGIVFALAVLAAVPAAEPPR